MDGSTPVEVVTASIPDDGLHTLYTAVVKLTSICSIKTRAFPILPIGIKDPVASGLLGAQTKFSVPSAVILNPSHPGRALENGRAVTI
jgi:hypothetical protein